MKKSQNDLRINVKPVHVCCLFIIYYIIYYYYLKKKFTTDFQPIFTFSKFEY